ncbi:thioredoxin [Hydrogenoanaerobacterium saccharovorans]|uniref:Thioredoxin n=1 Tax=Hydrogenoanaerobacterium saccharovorans TaxID=474960 RepID=A0A1H8B793_9FIRM|nr:thioredoxin [Hydrogenoanaerobacterium saccharovorans]RPF47551.1 thioredoxin [Hydrogenoanaerobacterium saccharovorans]SEM78722.1 thioredoxin [Hydrogenoanaerobacterium saccharovorans]
MATEHFNEETFEQEVIGGNGIALVDFWAEWCGPCRMLGPTIDELADELDGSVLVGKVNIDEQSNIAARFNVMTIPTVILFKDGEEVDRLVGFLPKQRFIDLVEKAKA